MPVPSGLHELIERFKRNYDQYVSQDYKEADLRKEFIDPLFEMLGWDMANRKGYAEQYKEVKFEPSLEFEGGTKSPDYEFRIGEKTAFYVEAKKPFVDIGFDKLPAYQLRRYAFSRSLPFSVLTNFKSTSVYDGRFKPNKNDSPATARVMRPIAFEDLEEKWDELAGIFSRDAVLKGSFDRLAEDHKAKHGTSEVNDEFLKEIESWREALAKNIALRNARLSIDELNFAVQKTIDRIIFLRMCEDRGTEPPNQIQRIADGASVYRRLFDLFQQADVKYNSGIFHFQEDKKRALPPDEITPTLKIDDGVLTKIIGNLYYPDSPYQFDVIPADILGQVYEQFLGKVIRLTDGHHAKVEEKPEVKKAGGVYYTPTYIVNYIVENTVGKLCSGKPPAEMSKLRILDPACGSGSFLIRAYERLLKEHLHWYTANEPKKWKNGVFQGPKGDWRLTLNEKKRVLLSSIYGVDVDSQAVEVTKLNLLLKALEGESRESVENVNKWFREPALPDLGKNIKCGNSLVDFDIMELLGDMSPEEQRAEVHQINPFTWSSEFPSAFKNGGFDVVIGNPPYVRSINLKLSNPFEWEYCRSNYVSASSREWDIYLVFVERMLKTLRPGGKFGYILPNKFLTSRVGENLRSILSRGRHLERLVHFGSFQIFRNVTTYTCLLFLNHDKTDIAEIARFKGGLATTICPLPDEEPKLWNEYTVKQSELSSSNWEALSSEGNVLAKIRSWPGLGSIAEIFSGTGTRADRVFLLESHGSSKGLIRVHSTQTEKDYELEPVYLKPALRGKSIGRYSTYPPELMLVVPYERMGENYVLASEKDMTKTAPRTFKYLEECKERLNEREKGRFKGDEWFCYGRPQNMNRFSVAEKIVMPDVVNRGECYLDSSGYWAIDTVYLITLKPSVPLSIRYVLGILNSRLLTHFLKETGSALRGGYFRMKTAYLTPFPIRPIDFSNHVERTHHDSMVSLVDRMLRLHEDLAEASTPDARMRHQRTIDATDSQINALVYQLYGLTEEEIGVVEHSS